MATTQAAVATYLREQARYRQSIAELYDDPHDYGAVKYFGEMADWIESLPADDPRFRELAPSCIDGIFIVGWQAQGYLTYTMRHVPQIERVNGERRELPYLDPDRILAYVIEDERREQEDLNPDEHVVTFTEEGEE